MTTGKTIALTRQTFVGKVMSLLFNMLSRLVILKTPKSRALKKANQNYLDLFKLVSQICLTQEICSNEMFLAFMGVVSKTHFGKC